MFYLLESSEEKSYESNLLRSTLQKTKSMEIEPELERSQRRSGFLAESHSKKQISMKRHFDVKCYSCPDQSRTSQLLSSTKLTCSSLRWAGETGRGAGRAQSCGFKASLFLLEMSPKDRERQLLNVKIITQNMLAEAKHRLKKKRTD